jgi:site-specific DNA-methyltransferase (adenine-specific)
VRPLRQAPTVETKNALRLVRGEGQSLHANSTRQVMKPYYEHAGITIYHGDCLGILPFVNADVLVTDPPYGIAYESGKTGHNGGAALPGITGDDDTSLRDEILAVWGDKPAIVFGSWKRPRPLCVAVLTWDKGDHVGMGDLSLPWKPNTEEIYILGKGFIGHRGSSVLSFNAPVSWNSVGFGRQHPNQKPLDLMKHLVGKCPTGVVLDPFMGSGTTLLAAKNLGRQSIGIEIEERYCEIAARRLAQEVLPL